MLQERNVGSTIFLEPGIASMTAVAVRGHGKVPTGGQVRSPLVAK